MLWRNFSTTAVNNINLNIKTYRINHFRRSLQWKKDGGKKASYIRSILAVSATATETESVILTVSPANLTIFKSLELT